MGRLMARQVKFGSQELTLLISGLALSRTEQPSRDLLDRLDELAHRALYCGHLEKSNRICRISLR